MLAGALGIPPFLPADLFRPLPGAQSRGVSFSEWESSRLDIAGVDMTMAFDDSNIWRDRDGKLNGNTGDTDASGLNVTDAVDSVIRGSESADEAPYQTAAAAAVDLASDAPGGGLGSDPDDDADDEGDDEDDGDANAPDPGANPPAVPVAPLPGPGSAPPPTTAATAPVTAPTPPTLPSASAVSTVRTSSETDGAEDWDFPYQSWVRSIDGGAASAVHTDEGTTLASGQDALVIGADGYDDDDIRAAGNHIVVTRDDGNVVIGGTGDVNSQIGDSEQGAVIMNVERTFIQGGGAY
jgi:hypothetical protein